MGWAGDRIHRRVEHVMGMPISLALRGRPTSSDAAEQAWEAVIKLLGEVDLIFSTYRDDSIINRLDRGEVLIDECPPEVAEVLNLGRQAERQTEGAFSINLPLPDGRRRLDPSGVVAGWAVQRAAGFLDALDETDYC
jgi:FAD:protein FMN transferase